MHTQTPVLTRVTRHFCQVLHTINCTQPSPTGAPSVQPAHKGRQIYPILRQSNAVNTHIFFKFLSSYLCLDIRKMLHMNIYIYISYWPLQSSASKHLHPLPTFSISCILTFFACLSTASVQLPLGLPTGLLPLMYSFSAFLGALSSFILNTWSTHSSLLNLIFLVSSTSLYTFYTLLLYLFRDCPSASTGP